MAGEDEPEVVETSPDFDISPRDEQSTVANGTMAATNVFRNTDENKTVATQF